MCVSSADIKLLWKPNLELCVSFLNKFCIKFEAMYGPIVKGVLSVTPPSATANVDEIQ